MKTFASSAATRRLSSARLELVSARRLRIGFQNSVLVLLLALLGTLALPHYSSDETRTSSLRDLQARSSALAAESAHLRTELAMERATRASLERQVVALNERVAELSGELDFRNAQRERQRATQ